jgi:hypothetical protein
MTFRGADWPEQPEEVGAGGMLRLDSTGFACALIAAYAQTHPVQG